MLATHHPSVVHRAESVIHRMMAPEISRTTGERFTVDCQLHGRKLRCAILTWDHAGIPDYVFPINGRLVKPKPKAERIAVTGTAPHWHGSAHFGRSRDGRLTWDIGSPYNPM